MVLNIPFPTGLSIPSRGCSGYPPLADYGLIGDLRSAALVSRAGSIDWLCLPRFDGDPVFGRLLDWDKGGFFEVRPGHGAELARRYLPGTNILETTWDDGGSKMRVTDFMPAPESPNDALAPTSLRLVRLMEPLSGSMEWQATYRPRANFGRKAVRLDRTADGLVAANSFLQSPSCSLEVRHETAVFHGRVSPGRPAVFLLFCGSNSRPKGITPDEAVPLRQQTEAYWKRWLGQRAARGPFASHLERSLLTVKLMQFGPSGAFVASPTSSLPESIGGSLNWDYRYAWLRDCSILVEALFSLGFDRDAERFLTWLYRVHERHPSKFQIMYRVDGDDPLPESTINGLDGYCSSRPVRVGNAAVHQRQLDVFGELMDAAFVGWRAGRRMTQAGRGTLRAIVEYLLKHWQDEGSGLWEARTRRRRYVYSQVMCWVAFDRALRMDDVLDLDVDRRQAVTLILKQIRHEILTRGFNPKLGSFTQSLDHPELDAAALHVLLSGMLPPDDPRVQSTVDVLQERLMQDGLLFRYAPEQGEFKQRESAFLICSAWLVRALTKLGRRQEAEALLQRIIDTQNDLGLMAEEFDPRSGRMLGNFPQTWSHLSLIRAILELEEHLATGLRWEQEAQWEKQPAT